MKFLRRKLCIPGRRYFSIFDTQKQISDKDGKSEKTDGERKPTKRVIQLVDEIMKLTLIEAADLCDLCHEKLALRGGNLPPPLPFPSPMDLVRPASPPNTMINPRVAIGYKVFTNPELSPKLAMVSDLVGPSTVAIRVIKPPRATNGPRISNSPVNVRPVINNLHSFGS